MPTPTIVNAADTAWVLISAALVLFMVPGLALFYAGQVPRRNTLAMLQQNFIPLGVVTITWILLGYTVAFGDDTGTGLVGDLKLFGMINAGAATPPAPAFHLVAAGSAIPTVAFVAFQMMFAASRPLSSPERQRDGSGSPAGRSSSRPGPLSSTRR